MVSSTYLHRKKNKQFTIAILRRSRTSGAKIIDGLKAHLEKHAPGEFTCILFDANGSEKTLTSQAAQIIQSYTLPYDAIITIGALASQVTSRLSLILNVPIPIIFASVYNPAHLGIIYAGNRGTKNISGIAAPPVNHEGQLSALYSLKKTIKRVLIPYNLTGAWFSQNAAQLQRMLNGKGIEVISAPIQKASDIQKTMTSYIQEIDTIITLRGDDSILSGMDTIINLSNDYGVTIYTSDIESVKQGAAIGFTNFDEKVGEDAADYLLKLFHENATPYDLPVKTSDSTYVLALNAANLQKQGIYVDDDTLDTLDKKIVFNQPKPTEPDGSAK